jgi:hypothetical protein
MDANIFTSVQSLNKSTDTMTISIAARLRINRADNTIGRVNKTNIG